MPDVGEGVATGTLAGKPAVLGGEPAFPDGLSLVRPELPSPDAVARDVRAIVDSRVLTNGPFVRRLEERVADYVGTRHAVAVASCTAGLMLVFRAREPSGGVVVPSFTFSATVHAVAWNGLEPVFADVEPQTLTLDPARVREALDAGAAAVLATHTFGTPCDVNGLWAAASDAGVPLFFDAAHALGSRLGGTPMGRFGDAEVFSLTPTKLVVAGEGGIIATDDDDLAEACRIGREYANPGDYDTRFVGLNARMSEFHGALALRSLDGLDARVARRGELAARYREGLALQGITFPTVRDGDVSTFKDFTILVEPEGFGVDAPCLAGALAAEGIDTRRYYAPPVHAQQAYRHLRAPDLPVTEWAVARVLTLPLWSEMTEAQVDRVAEAVARIGRYPEVAGTCAGEGRR
jgi:dTDP-4-amino-4,6-dideoxygalactose transaminase